MVKQVLLLSLVTFAWLASAQLNPMFYVPGMAVSLLQVRVYQNASVPEECRHAEPILAWLNPKLYVNPLRYHCIFHYLRMEFNNQSKQWQSPTGLHVETVDFGSPNSTISGIPFAEGVTSKLFRFLQTLGYQFAKDLFVVPYDWRRAPETLILETEFPKRLANLVEEAVRRTGRKAIILSHSNGGPLVYRFLQHVSREWKDQFVAASVFVSANWVGQFNTFRDVTFSSGWDLPLILYSRELNGRLIRSLEVAASCMPNLYHFASSFYVSMQSRNFTVSQIADFLHSRFPIEFGPLLYAWRQILAPSFEYPCTELIRCYNLYGTGVKTEQTYFFDRIDESLDVIKHEPSRYGYDYVRNLPDSTTLLTVFCTISAINKKHSSEWRWESGVCRQLCSQ